MSPLSLPWTFTKDDPAGPDLEERLQDVLDTVAQQFPVGAENLQSAFAPVTGTTVVTMPAIIANGTAVGTASGLAFDGRTPSVVVATPTTGGSIYFSNQYLIGTDSYVADGFNILMGSNGVAFAAGWTIAINYAAYF